MLVLLEKKIFNNVLSLQYVPMQNMKTKPSIQGTNLDSSILAFLCIGKPQKKTLFLMTRPLRPYPTPPHPPAIELSGHIF